jgi:hypothetical protein
MARYANGDELVIHDKNGPHNIHNGEPVRIIGVNHTNPPTYTVLFLDDTTKTLTNVPEKCLRVV